MTLNLFSHYKNKNGFTLAEILITLVIIGVVAALTISALINTYVESSTVSKVKKAISILGQAKKLAEAQNGSIEGWDFGSGATAETASQFWSYLKPHISLAKDCGSASECYGVNTIHYLNGGSSGLTYSEAKYYHFVLADGSVMWFRTGGENGSGRCSNSVGGVENICARFWYDVNGNKKPNAAGNDIFIFEMTVDGVYPHNDTDCHKNATGWGCTAYVIKNGNMKYLH